MAELLGLPDDTLLHIFHYLPQSVKHPKPQADLLNLIVTCKQIAPLAREVLFCSPILESSKIREFLRILFKYEDLQDTIKTLTIETRDALHGIDSRGPIPVPALDKKLRSDCIGHVRSLWIMSEDYYTKSDWIDELRCSKIMPWTLFGVLSTMLTNLKELYLSGSMLGNFPFLQDILTCKDFMGEWDYVDKREFVLGHFCFGLRVLELPVDSYLPVNKGVRDLPGNFPNLRKLILPAHLVEYITDLEAIVSFKLESLVLTDDTDYDRLDGWISDVVLDQAECCPNLRSLSVYRAHSKSAIDLELLNRIKGTNITCEFTILRRWR